MSLTDDPSSLSKRHLPRLNIPFNRITFGGNELKYIREVLADEHIAGNGAFTERCRTLLETLVGGHVLLTHSCTAGLEMAVILANIASGDEVIMPSFTFPSTANAVVLRGGVPVFVDIRPDTLNLDEKLIQQAITSRTRAICVVHYAGLGCNMDKILSLAARHNLIVIEDAAQALHASYRGRPLGSFGALAAFSFHESKNIISGEGGALVINDPALVERAEIIWEKGTNRAQFARGLVAKYMWLDVGSSFLPSEITAAFLLAQLEVGRDITNRRIAVWSRYHAALESFESAGLLRRPVVPEHCIGNGHIYYVLAPDNKAREHWRAVLSEKGIGAFFHYVPLHTTPGGRKYGRTSGPMHVTDAVAGNLIRLPLHAALSAAEQDEVIASLQMATGMSRI